jgi:glycosyltransferase involved in cell wall biosynthesis
MIRQPPTLSIIVPCYNEEDVVEEAANRLSRVLDELISTRHLGPDSYIYFIDDGSVDRTWTIIKRLNQYSDQFRGIKLSRNCGHQNALLAGLLTVPGDLALSIDADLQDDPGTIKGMLEAQANGADIVFGVRSARKPDTYWKRETAHAYYRLLRWMGVVIVHDHADYRLMNRRVINALRQYKESNVFLRALIAQLGFKTATVSYERLERFAGTSKYSVHKMLSLAWEGITSFSTRPLRMITLFGFVVSAVSFLLSIWAFLATIFGKTVPGWASTVVPIYLICGVQLLCLGVIGEYIGKIYLETKGRPRFLIDEVVAGSPSREDSSADSG